MAVLRFVVVADSHIRHPDDDVATYPSNALMVGRNRRVVQMCNELGAEFVIHLGDIVHPLPIEDSHEPAIALAREVYDELRIPIHYVVGNHDVGDKPDAMVAVPPVAEENYPVFERSWGPSYQSFAHGDCHFVLVDTPVLNSGLTRETRQRVWLESDLAQAAEAGRRIFVFTHYPPFVRDPAEDEHYDNLGEPARSWFLDLLAHNRVEAVFSGHVHNFLYNHYRETKLYVVPSTGFVRPDYAELAAVAPEREGGRDDRAKLGFFVVDITAEGHDVRPVRTFGITATDSSPPVDPGTIARRGWRSPIGVTLRHDWMATVGFPTSGLDEFRRKTIRNDSLLPALWEARIDQVRIPLGDLSMPDRLQRIRQLSDRGLRPSVRSIGIPVPRTLAAIDAAADLLARWEVVVWPVQLERALEALLGFTGALPVAFAPLQPIGDAGAAAHHFVSSGFRPDDSDGIAALVAADGAAVVDEIMFRIPPTFDVAPAVTGAVDLIRESGRGAVITVELPRAGENTLFDDDEVLADRVEQAVRAAVTYPEAAVFLDGFMDHDRSYYPRIGLVDRRFNPRPALHRLITAAATIAGARTPRP